MPPSVVERLATLEAVIAAMRSDVREVATESKRSRGRLHDLEKVTTGLLELQKQMHRQNERRIRRITLAIQFGSLMIGTGMMALGIATYLAHG